MTTTQNTSRQIRLGNTAKGGTVLVRATPATKAEYVAQMERIALARAAKA